MPHHRLDIWDIKDKVEVIGPTSQPKTAAYNIELRQMSDVQIYRYERAIETLQVLVYYAEEYKKYDKVARAYGEIK